MKKIYEISTLLLIIGSNGILQSSTTPTTQSVTIQNQLTNSCAKLGIIVAINNNPAVTVPQNASVSTTISENSITSLIITNYTLTTGGRSSTCKSNTNTVQSTQFNPQPIPATISTITISEPATGSTIPTVTVS